MSITPDAMLTWCRHLLDPAADGMSEYLAAIPRLDWLGDLPAGTPVLVRGDVDAKPGAEVGQADIRLRSMLQTLNYGRQRGWKQIVFGHIGRKPEGSLAKVARRLGQLLSCEVPLVDDWLDAATTTIRDQAAGTIRAAEPGSVMMLQNTRKYDIERALWKAGEADLPGLVDQLARLANEFSEKVARVYVNEALSAGSLDSSSTIVPAGMERVALGDYVAGQFNGPMMRCLKAQLVVFSGLKIDKLDDLEAMVDRGTIRMVISAGSLAMALKKAAARLGGGQFCLGLAEDPAHRDKPYYIPPRRIQQASCMVEQGREKGIEFVLPIDFVLADGQPSESIGPPDQQFDVGPKTSQLFAQKVEQFIHQYGNLLSNEPAVAFHNGVFGMFEDPRFEDGTRQFIAQLKRLKEAGVEVYVGGGEGGKALEKYGQPDWVTHVFTAGGTVLNALGSKPVPYLVALRMAANCA